MALAAWRRMGGLMPVSKTDPQGAEGRETRWVNVYAPNERNRVSYYGLDEPHDDRREADAEAKRAESIHGMTRIAIEEVTITTQVTRHPLGGTERE